MSLLEYHISTLTDKNNRRILPILEDMRVRDNAVLICSFGGDDPEAPIGAYLAGHHENLIVSGLRHLAEIGSCGEFIIYSGEIDAGAIAEKLRTLANLPVSVISGPSSPVLREPTALYSVIETGTIRAGNAEEDYKRTFPSYGYQGRPTLVVDAETAYQAGRLCDEPGCPLTKHIAVLRPGTEAAEITEVPVGTTLEALLAGKAVPKPPLLGGLWGSFIDLSNLKDTIIQFSFFCDAVRILGDSDCAVALTADLMKNNKELSCAKCVLCREGSWQLHAVFGDITEGKASRDDIALIEDICPLIAAGSLCAFGRNMVMPALTASAVCRNEMTEHIVGKNCPAGQCKGLMSYLIDPALCVKCGKCLASCPEGAIKFGEKIKVPKKLTKVGKFH